MAQWSCVCRAIASVQCTFASWGVGVSIAALLSMLLGLAPDPSREG
jgi:hypothetical protein